MNTEPITRRAADKRYLPCKCGHKHFDSEFGVGVRPHNPLQKKDAWRCVVCSDVKASP
jgi:hypothetical protein